MTEETEDAIVTEGVEPVEAEAEAEETTEVEATQEDGETSESSTEEKDTQGVQKRIDELTRLRREAERERDYYRQLAEQTPKEQPKEPELGPMKSLEDFDYDDAKYTAYLMSEASARAVESAKRALQAEQAAERARRMAMDFQSREDEYAKEFKDYHDVTRKPDLPITADMVNVLGEMDDGPKVLYYLGKNPDITARLARLSPTSLARELGRIEERLATKPQAEKVSKAPPPPPKVAGTSPATTVNPTSADSDKLSTAEWLKRRQKQLAAR